MRYQIHKAAIQFGNGQIELSTKVLYWVWDDSNKEYTIGFSKKKEAVEQIKEFIQMDQQ